MSSSVDILMTTIKTLQERVDQLEAELKFMSSNEYQSSLIRSGLRRFRLHGVIPLLVTSGDIDTLKDAVAKSSPSLVESVSEVWPLETSGLSTPTKSEIQEKANNVMDRW